MTNREVRISSEFKAQTTKAISSIVFFILTYVIMLLLAMGLTAACIYGGIMLIAFRPMFLTILLGIGLASLGVLVLIFLLKFIFKSHKVDRSHLFEITKADEPELFGLITSIVDQVGTTFPKKVYLSSDVNASVFYDSSFWSMFLPVKKNLVIGLGLVNSISKAELTAILSHEFGHFSQKTMKVGSYVYNVNQVIFNLLYDNESYERIIHSWANVSGYFSIFVVFAIKIIEGIQWFLKMAYELVNKSYMGLSREMEFHADEIAAGVTGLEPLKESLLRMSLADHSFNSVLSFYEGRISANQKSENLYQEQKFVMHFLAEDRNLAIENGLPKVSYDDLNKFNKSKLVIKDQWASHPSIEDRIESLEKTGLHAQDQEFIPAAQVFQNILKTQEDLTTKMFATINYQALPVSIPLEDFKKQFQSEFLKNSFSAIYNNYYNDKNPLEFKLSQVSSKEDLKGIKDLFSDQMVDLVYTSIALENDLETLKQIAIKSLPIKTFDYDGKKYQQKDTNELIKALKNELEQINSQIKQNDLEIFHFFRELEQKQKPQAQLENHYREFFNFDQEFQSKYEAFVNLSKALEFVGHQTPFDQIRLNFTRMKTLEAKLKTGIKDLLAQTVYTTEITEDIRSNFEMYLSKDWQYFSNEHYLNHNLEILYAAMNNYAFVLSRGYFVLKKQLLDYQDELLSPAN